MNVGFRKLKRARAIGALCAALGLGLGARVAKGADRDTRPIVVVVEGDASSWTNELRQAIARELRMHVIAPDDPKAPSSRGTLLVSLSTANAEVLVRYTPAQGSEIARSIHAPENHARAVRATTLLVGNLVRNEAQEILDAARKPSRPRADTASGSASSATPIPETADPDNGGPNAPTSNPREPAPGDVGPEPSDTPADASGRVIPTLPVLQPMALIERPCVKRQASAPYFPVVGALVHPLATNFRAPHIKTNFALNLVYGRAGRVQGLDLGVAGNVGCDVDGVQGQFVVARAGGRVRGLQVSGVVSWTDETLTGIQGSLAFNRARRVEGAQVASLNVAREVSGGQFAFVNVARDVVGGQFGFINYAGDVEGVQIGLVNVARRVRGLQLGLVNVSENADVAVGFISLTKSSYIRPVVWLGSSTYRSLNVGIRFDTRWMYQQLAFGYVDGSNFNDASTIQTWGFHALKPDDNGFLFDLEIGTLQRFAAPEEEDKLRAFGHIVGGWRVSKRAAFFGGMGIVFAQKPNDSLVAPDVIAGAIF
ncbi:LA_2272 family surface repeat-containing protein [Pendulispora albinea]|uniref:LA_2272 family surface repeat-containing protein n=1 Tax=Pendulispora albinea TaxID=2741071 RepID=UPI00374E14CF